MKGPHLRLKFDFHRRWECPKCHAKASSGGHVTSMHCPACDKNSESTLMRMSYDGEPSLAWREQLPVASVSTPAGDMAMDEQAAVKKDSKVATN